MSGMVAFLALVASKGAFFSFFFLSLFLGLWGLVSMSQSDRIEFVAAQVDVSIRPGRV